MAKRLIAFYSRTGENYVNGNITNLDIGNTEIAVNMLKEILEDADVFKIEQENPYSDNYSICIDEAKNDLENGIDVKLKSYLTSIDDYDEIYLAYPIYWDTMPVAVHSFLKHYNFDNKKIFPLATHEGSHLGSSVDDIRKLAPNTFIEKSLAIHGANVKNARELIENWVK